MAEAEQSGHFDLSSLFISGNMIVRYGVKPLTDGTDSMIFVSEAQAIRRHAGIPGKGVHSCSAALAPRVRWGERLR